MTTVKPLTNINWGPDVTLSGLIKDWMKLNHISSIAEARAVMKDLDIRGRKSLDLWLKDEVTKGLLTSGFSGISKHIFDVDQWMMCEAKRQLLKRRSDLSGKIDFDSLRTRADLIGTLRPYYELYGGGLYLALQVQIQHSLFNHWFRGRTRPGLDYLPRLIEAILEDHLIVTDHVADVSFTMMCRAILGADPQTLFGVNSVEDALKLLAQPYKGHALKHIADEVRIPAKSLREWKSRDWTKKGFPPSSVALIVRGLLIQRWPEHVETFELALTDFQENERMGIWRTNHPVRLPIDSTSQRTQPKAKQPETPPTEKKSRSPRTAGTVEIQNRKSSVRKHTSEPVNNEPATTVPQAAHDPTHVILGKIFKYAAEQFGHEAPNEPRLPLALAVGETVGEIEHCLTRNSWRANGGDVSASDLQRLARCVSALRSVLVHLSQNDPIQVHNVIAPVIGPELVELFLAWEGLRHLLSSDEAWEIIEAGRHAVSLSRNIQ